MGWYFGFPPLAATVIVTVYRFAPVASVPLAVINVFAILDKERISQSEYLPAIVFVLQQFDLFLVLGKHLVGKSELERAPDVILEALPFARV
ncbi:MAG TPA: hypothetical protein OIL80_00255 [Adlercreutzia equolifaciens]|uniref:hypothetical protein n=1 Tax=Adlercreutzia equolifaciens TaxID=446660 RepID=UPI00242D32B6|nr:hypothetical protein [Adlercreutzia equolifaciens]HJI11163.1 hypothetical protein [Adlercreutzia equolifaciens]